MVDRGIARIRLGETSTAIADLYGAGHLRIHPATRTYTIRHVIITVQFDHAERATSITSDTPALRLDGQPLSRGYLFWAAGLHSDGWTVGGCPPHADAAISPSRHTSILWADDRVYTTVSEIKATPGCF